MDKFLIGFVVGAVVGAGLALLLTPDDKTKALRDTVRKTTDRYASGAESPTDTLNGIAQKQKNRLEAAVDAGKRANAERQAELWAQLQLPQPNDGV
jgi:gas vesicle protein